MADKNMPLERLDRLTIALVEDLLSASDAEILSEATADGSIDEILESARRDLAAVATRVGKAKLASARAAVDQNNSRRIGKPTFDLSKQTMRDRLIRFAESLGVGSKLTLAARNGQSIPDEDLVGLLEDISDLGVNIDILAED